MLSRRGLPTSPPPFTAADCDDTVSFLGVVGAGGASVAAATAVAAAEAAPASAFAPAGLGLSTGSALVPGLAMLPLQFDFIPSVPSTHLSTIAGAFFLETSPNLRVESK